MLRGLAGWPLVFLILVGLIPVSYLVERHRSRAAWETYAINAAARGTKLKFADYLPPPVPDAENFARIPIFEGIFAAHSSTAPYFFDLRNKSDQKMPPFASSARQERIDLQAWQAHLVKAKFLPAAGDDAAADVLKALDRFSGPLEQLRAASTRPFCRFPVKWEQGIGAGMPHLEMLRSTAQLHALRMAALLAQGQSAAACDEFHAGLRLFHVTRDEPALISAIVRIVCLTTLEDAVWDGLAAHRWAEPDIRRIEASLADIDCLKIFVTGLNGDRGTINDLFDSVIRDPKRLETLSHFEAGPPSLSDKMTAWFYPLGWLYRSKLRSNTYIDEILASVDPAQRRWFGDQSFPSAPDNITDPLGKSQYALFALVAPPFEKSLHRFVRAETLQDHLRIACALERFWLARGAWPETLAELSPDYLAAIPREIVNGAPYQYRRTPEGAFVLYSIGIDRRDDGGEIDSGRTGSEQRDWVWSNPRPK